MTTPKSFRLADEEIVLLEKEANKTGETQSAIVRRLIRDHLGADAAQERMLAHQRIEVLASVWGMPIYKAMDRATELALALVTDQRARIIMGEDGHGRTV